MIPRILKKFLKTVCNVCGSTDTKTTKVTEIISGKETFLEKRFECETCKKVYERK